MNKGKDPFEEFRSRKNEEDVYERGALPNDSLGRISDYFLKVEDPDAKVPPAATSAVRRLEALTELLIDKGVITEKELIDALRKHNS